MIVEITKNIELHSYCPFELKNLFSLINYYFDHENAQIIQGHESYLII